MVFFLTEGVTVVCFLAEELPEGFLGRTGFCFGVPAGEIGFLDGFGFFVGFGVDFVGFGVEAAGLSLFVGLTAGEGEMYASSADVGTGEAVVDIKSREAGDG